jgi:pilus assembly protein CpaC
MMRPSDQPYRRPAQRRAAPTLARAVGVAIGALICAASLGDAFGQTTSVARQHRPAGSNQLVTLGVGKSIPVELPRDARDVIVANPAIANAVVRSARRVFLIGVAVGQTNVFFIDAEGRQIAAYDIEVGRDLGGLRQTLRSVLPDANIEVRSVNDSVVVSGSVATPLEAQQAIDVAARLVGDEKKVVNAISIRGRDQVHLKVTVAEIQRTAVRQLGIRMDAFNPVDAITAGQTTTGLANAGSFVYGLITSGRSNVNNIDPSPNTIQLGSRMGNNVVTSTIRAFEENGLVRTLAEPTLTSISGEQAKFVAGGEFPVPTGRDITGNITLEYKPFGVILAFTPVVLSEGRISLRVGVEVSEISNDVSLRLAGGTTGQGINVPGLRTRRADTTIELPSGGSMVLAGLLQEQTRQAIGGMPGAMNLPVLGALFRSRDYQRGQTELMVMVTPYIVRPVSANQLARPDDNYQDASDPAGMFIGRLNRIYGTAGAPAPRGRFNGPVGFIRD